MVSLRSCTRVAWRPCGLSPPLALRTNREMVCAVLHLQAKNLVWADLSAEQLASLRAPKKGSTARQLLAKYLDLTDLSQPTQAILLDLYVNTLQQGQVWA